MSLATFEVLGVTGDKLRYALQFGDGTAGDAASAAHVYPNAGSYTATLTVTDAAEHTVTATRSIVVRSIREAWFHAGFNQRSGRFEVRRLIITAQDGANLRGALTQDGIEQPFSGRVTEDRRLEGRLADGTRLTATISATVFDESSPIAISLTGGPMDGETLIFKPIIGDAPGSGPKAQLDIDTSYHNLKWAIMGLTPIKFDASQSSGDALTYFIELGDGSVSSLPVVAQPVMVRGSLTARVTVVDKYGRSDSIRRSFDVRSLSTTNVIGEHWYGYGNQALTFWTHEGRYVTGMYKHTGDTWWQTRFTGTLGGEQDIHVVLDDGTIEFKGTLLYEPNRYYYCQDIYMLLKVRGGAADGRTVPFDIYWSEC